MWSWMDAELWNPIPAVLIVWFHLVLWNIIQNWFQLGDKRLRALLFMSNPRPKTGVTTSDGCVPSNILHRTKASNWHSLFNVVTQKIKLQDLWGGILWVYLIQSPHRCGNHPGGEQSRNITFEHFVWSVVDSQHWLMWHGYDFSVVCVTWQKQRTWNTDDSGKT